MRPRTEALLGLIGLTVVGAAVAILGRSDRVEVDRDRRPSTFLAGPLGSRGLLESTRALGVAVERFRGRPRHLPPARDGERTLLAILDPAVPITAPELGDFLAYGASADLLLAGPGAEPLMRCFGYRPTPTRLDSVAVDEASLGAIRVSRALEPTGEATYADSSRLADLAITRCAVPHYTRVSSLLGSARGPVALRLERGDSGGTVILVADATLFRNKWLRDTEAGRWALTVITGHYNRVIFEERHQGFRASGSLADATLAWSIRSPWGWAAWQLAAVGLLALLSAAVRFGPVMPGPSRQRRSSLEHVRALAAALSAAKGHDEAIAAMVRGLRRRLAPPSLRPRGDWRAWLADLERRATTDRARQAVSTLRQLTTPGQPAESVRLAADAVEDVWQTLRS